MKPRASRILSAAAAPMLPVRPQLADLERSDVLLELDEFLVAQVWAMPRYLLAPYLVALLAFEAFPLLRHGRFFSSLAVSERAVIVRRWSASPIGPMRDLLKLIRSCTLFFYLDHPLVARRMEEEAGRRSSREGQGDVDGL
jgi:hypothetical protein